MIRMRVASKAFDGMSLILNGLPPRMIKIWVRILSLFWYWCVPFRVNLILNNLKLVYGKELTDREIRTLAKKNLEHYLYFILEFIQFRKMDLEDFKKRVSIQDIEFFNEALALGRGAIAMTSHMGNFEWMAARSPLFDLPLHMIVRPMKSGVIDQIISEQRQRTGVGLISAKNSKWEIFRLLKNDKIVGVIFDQRKGSDYVLVNFFGFPARTTKGLAYMAERLDSIIVPVYCYRTDYGKVIIQCEPPVEYKRVGTREENIYHNTQVFTNVVEKMVRRHPEQWSWIHDRWKQ